MANLRAKTLADLLVLLSELEKMGTDLNVKWGGWDDGSIVSNGKQVDGDPLYIDSYAYIHEDASDAPVT